MPSTFGFPSPSTPDRAAHSASASASAAPSGSSTPFSGCGTPVPISAFGTPTTSPLATPKHTPPPSFDLTSLPKPVILNFGSHSLTGSLYLISTSDLLNGLFPRFFDILPSQESPVNEVADPHVIFHAVQGLSWVDGRSLPAPRDFFDERGNRVREQFIAVTDDTIVWSTLQVLGSCTLDGTFTPTVPTHPDIILALPIRKALPGGRRETPDRTRGATKTWILDYPPIPIVPALYATITTLRAAIANAPPWARVTSGAAGIGRKYLIEICNSISKKPNGAGAAGVPILDPTTGVLNPEHKLWLMRGNVALWSTGVWKLLCYTSVMNKADRDARPLPEPFYENVFEDLRERERFAGTDELDKVQKEWWEWDLSEEWEEMVRGRKWEEGREEV